MQHWQQKRNYPDSQEEQKLHLHYQVNMVRKNLDGMSELWYDTEEDVLGIQFSKMKYWKSIEVASNVVVDLAKNGEIIGIEILKVKS
jgi:uncharacterized protein YuzE